MSNRLIAMLIAITSIVGATTGVNAQSADAARAGEWYRDVLVIYEGESLTIKEDMKNIRTDLWKMEDRSTIVVPVSIGSLSIFAEKATIGKGVRIIGRGSDGRNGRNGENGRGYNGTDGERSQDGVDVNLSVGFQSLGSLEIIAHGGAGGKGGNGGKGVPGGKASCTHGGYNGWQGGNGGNGGDGGNGGNVHLEYWLVGDAQPVQEPSIAINVRGGKAGARGEAGAGGDGGRGAVCGKKPFAFYRGGGDAGPPGRGGSSGARGQDGSHTVRVLGGPPTR